ncbi:MAG: hypothetical protein V2J07_08765 [Anaerolineae bacterium]|nr:hypothetical protein [Anaerolineae bacterium]
MSIFLLVILILLGVAFLLVRPYLTPANSSGIDPTLVMLLTLHVHQDEINTQVAAQLATSAPQNALPVTTGTLQASIVPPQATATVNTPQPGQTPLPSPTIEVPAGHIAYIIQTGDTLKGIRRRFEVDETRIVSAEPLPKDAFLAPGTVVFIPFDPLLHAYGPDTILLPDVAVVNGLLDAGFDIETYVQQSGGFLSRYVEESRGEYKSGVQIVEEIANLHSISPKLLLAVLEYQSGWVMSDEYSMAADRYPIGYGLSTAPGLYEELYIAARELGKGYYWWRDGSWPEIYLDDEEPLILHPSINAGTSALSTLMAGLYNRQNWTTVLYGPDSFTNLYTRMFGDPFIAAAGLPDLIPFGLMQPTLELPFQNNEDYHLTSGPHRAWGHGSPWAAVDFAPADGLVGCAVSPFWVTSMSAGVVVRSEEGKVLVDLDMDGDERTGWVLFYLHIATNDRVAVGTTLNVNDRIGHASCEGGVASGSHVHIARKYNGEWITAGGPVPLVMSGWKTVSAMAEYGGYLIRDGKVVYSYPYSVAESRISRD